MGQERRIALANAIPSIEPGMLTSVNTAQMSLRDSSIVIASAALHASSVRNPASSSESSALHRIIASSSTISTVRFFMPLPPFDPGSTTRIGWRLTFQTARERERAKLAASWEIQPGLGRNSCLKRRDFHLELKRHYFERYDSSASFGGLQRVCGLYAGDRAVGSVRAT